MKFFILSFALFMQVLHWRQISSLRHRCYGVSMVHWRQIELRRTIFNFFSQKFLTDVIVTMVLLGGVLHTSTQLLMRFASVPTPSKCRKWRENERNGRSMAVYFHGGSVSMSSFWLWRSHSVWLLGFSEPIVHVRHFDYAIITFDCGVSRCPLFRQVGMLWSFSRLHFVWWWCWVVKFHVNCL